jgi:hypothetical protein
VASKFATLVRRRGIILVVAAVAAVVGSAHGVSPFGFFDGGI